MLPGFGDFIVEVEVGCPKVREEHETLGHVVHFPIAFNLKVRRDLFGLKLRELCKVNEDPDDFFLKKS